MFLDDDPDYLEMLAVVLPQDWHVKLFLRPAQCINYLLQEPPFWEADAWNQQQLVDQWREGKPLIPQILGYWARYTERYAMTRVFVVDYSMPAMNGLQALAELVEWPGSRVLLTGQADEQIAVQAFNRGLIDQFIAKQAPDISRRLVSAVSHLMSTPNARHAQTWRATLRPQHSTLLRLPSVARELAAFASKQWSEYVVIGDPFGVLGMDAQGAVSWLQLETPQGLNALAELAEVEGIAGAGLEQIRSGRQLADIELRQALGRAQPVQLMPAFAMGQNGELLAALFPVPADEHNRARIQGYGEWLRRQEQRKVEG
ncbi:candidate response regulator, atypical CheY [Ramlibacter tataouinensis TTB310]|uniref:Candidate response regulator, atypical CheY n=1 Tax=Ramlibacter tataouinensis (strain ATCC BAA-407 / DSM 14655 / LMG 21543 / TTB310) TaxID=365046 RepID=F5XYD9_RAMTT|nr:candidate response regulator, atypical CheY [Ramlibacter tataouinensis TTB310]